MARIVGISVASLSMVMQFMFIPHYPFWSLAVIALDGCDHLVSVTYRRNEL